MDALSARCGKGPIVACIGLILATGMASPAHADSLALHLAGDGPIARSSFPVASSAVEYSSTNPSEKADKSADEAADLGALLGLFTAGTVMFADNPKWFNDNPPPTDLTPNTDNTVPKDGSTDKDGKIQGGPTTPEPASLLIGVIGSACGGIAVWLRRRKKAEPA